MAKKKKPVVWCRPLICGHQYEVLIANKENCRFLPENEEATTYWEDSTIAVRDDLADGRKEDCLMHEVFVHAVMEASGAARVLKDKHKFTSKQWDDFEEDLALLWAPAILATLKANGWLKLPKIPGKRRTSSLGTAVKAKPNGSRKVAKK